MTESPSHVRSAGILLHPTSLPGAHGLGELGPHARRFVDLLAGMDLGWWQMLPVGPTGYADSPYQSPSTFAGNPLLISLDDLVDDGLLTPAEAVDHRPFPDDRVDYGQVIPAKTRLLHLTTERFRAHRGPELRVGFEEFVHAHGPVWLHDFALFTAIKRSRNLEPWWTWDRGLAQRHPRSMARTRDTLAREVEEVLIEQYLFDRQFGALHQYAAGAGIRLIGDIPIFVAHDSADVWANPDLFHLDESGMPTVVAGVPPDYFSATGQRWGNPLYDWEQHVSSDFAWWKSRMKRVLELFDLVRIDHFRGFAASWHIPAEEETAVVGEWVPAPGIDLFDSLTEVFGEMPVIAEDLGVITADVERLRDRYGFPGMKVLQFGFGVESSHSLDQFRPNVVAYTGTHDNDTALGWWLDESEERQSEHQLARRELGTDGTQIHWDMIRAVFESVANTAVVPMQDVLGLDTSARMNTPATESGNWTWRFQWKDVKRATVRRLRGLVEDTKRSNPAPPRSPSPLMPDGLASTGRTRRR